jgi:hypothetical protein
MSIGPVGESALQVSAPVTLPALAPSPSRAAEPSTFARLLRGVGNEVQRGETVVRGAVASASGGELSAASLIALQAQVYRYSEVVDLASRLVDHATTALKTVIQNQ